MKSNRSFKQFIFSLSFSFPPSPFPIFLHPFLSRAKAGSRVSLNACPKGTMSWLSLLLHHFSQPQSAAKYWRKKERKKWEVSAHFSLNNIQNTLEFMNSRIRTTKSISLFFVLCFPLAGQCKWDFTPSPPPDLRLWLENSRNCSWDSPGMYVSMCLSICTPFLLLGLDW